MLILEHIKKSFGPTVAVDDVSLRIERGEIVGLLGENGAGKTTLMRMVAGEIKPDAGAIERPPRTGIVHQHFALVSNFTIAENLALAGDRRLRFASRATLEREAKATIEATGIDLQDVRRRASDLSVGERAKLELIKAVAAKPELLILDEPTSVLTPLESADLFRLIRELASAGTAVVFITHKIAEVMEVASRLVVMRRGRVVLDTPEGLTADEIAQAMVAEPSPGLRPPSPARGRGHGETGVRVVLGTLTLKATEILAIVGVAGNGQRELAERVRALARNSGFIPEDRTRDALIAEMTIAENIALGSRRWRPADARVRAERLINLYNIKARGPLQLAGELSGGNQQKVVLARELDRRPEVIVASEPTRGLDIEATRFVHEQLRIAAAAGAAILLITSDLDEAFALADGIHVIYRGRLSERMTPREASDRVAALMAGVA
ncbi:MAG TPA: ATP-binding cassette domain-containing protein [Thermoanaerobaculia bacterium]|nr:ATP-binding cassette domain-containing protein [Thermoanaerobaculia bacterium]